MPPSGLPAIQLRSPMPADYHTHTPLCQHATGTPEEYVEAAVAAGLDEYGISDHAPCRPEPFDDWRMLESELPEYFDWIIRAKQAAGDRVKIRAGMECDWLRGCEGFIEELAGKYDWDYLIGSVHYLGSWDFDNPKWLGKWAQTDVEATWTEYWKTYAAMAESGLFDILAHPDLVKKFSHVPPGDLDRFYDPVIEAIAANGSVIELNTAGWHKPCAEAYPAPRFLELAASAGIGLVISSDAHAPTEIARDFGKARELAKAAGYRETQRFEKRRHAGEPCL
jgi:histidinol-phosphatase (PHP family)